MDFNQGVLDWQNSLPGFGISYAGPKDGLINQQFISAMLALEAKWKAYGEIFTGSGVKMSVRQAQQKYTQPEPVKDVAPKTIETPINDTKVWETFLNQTLPVVGKVYSGDLAEAGKKLEAAIGKSINKSMAGIIWSDQKKQFNTTPDDIKKALNLIQLHDQNPPKQAEFTQDQRVAGISKILTEK